MDFPWDDELDRELARAEALAQGDDDNNDDDDNDDEEEETGAPCQPAASDTRKVTFAETVQERTISSANDTGDWSSIELHRSISNCIDGLDIDASLDEGGDLHEQQELSEQEHVFEDVQHAADETLDTRGGGLKAFLSDEDDGDLAETDGLFAGPVAGEYSFDVPDLDGSDSDVSALRDDHEHHSRDNLGQAELFEEHDEEASNAVIDKLDLEPSSILAASSSNALQLSTSSSSGSQDITAKAARWLESTNMDASLTIPPVDWSSVGAMVPDTTAISSSFGTPQPTLTMAGSADADPFSPNEPTPRSKRFEIKTPFKSTVLSVFPGRGDPNDTFQGIGQAFGVEQSSLPHGDHGQLDAMLGDLSSLDPSSGRPSSETVASAASMAHGESSPLHVQYQSQEAMEDDHFDAGYGSQVEHGETGVDQVENVHPGSRVLDDFHQLKKDMDEYIRSSGDDFGFAATRNILDEDFGSPGKLSLLNGGSRSSSPVSTQSILSDKSMHNDDSLLMNLDVDGRASKSRCSVSGPEHDGLDGRLAGFESATGVPHSAGDAGGEGGITTPHTTRTLSTAEADLFSPGAFFAHRSCSLGSLGGHANPEGRPTWYTPQMDEHGRLLDPIGPTPNDRIERQNVTGFTPAGQRRVRSPLYESPSKQLEAKAALERSQASMQHAVDNSLEDALPHMPPPAPIQYTSVQASRQVPASESASAAATPRAQNLAPWKQTGVTWTTDPMFAMHSRGATIKPAAEADSSGSSSGGSSSHSSSSQARSDSGRIRIDSKLSQAATETATNGSTRFPWELPRHQPFSLPAAPRQAAASTGRDTIETNHSNAASPVPVETAAQPIIPAELQRTVQRHVQQHILRQIQDHIQRSAGSSPLMRSNGPLSMSHLASQPASPSAANRYTPPTPPSMAAQIPSRDPQTQAHDWYNEILAEQRATQVEVQQQRDPPATLAMPATPVQTIRIPPSRRTGASMHSAQGSASQTLRLNFDAIHYKTTTKRSVLVVNDSKRSVVWTLDPNGPAYMLPSTETQQQSRLRNPVKHKIPDTVFRFSLLSGRLGPGEAVTITGTFQPLLGGVYDQTFLVHAGSLVVVVKAEGEAISQSQQALNSGSGSGSRQAVHTSVPADRAADSGLQRSQSHAVLQTSGALPAGGETRGARPGRLHKSASVGAMTPRPPPSNAQLHPPLAAATPRCTLSPAVEVENKHSGRRPGVSAGRTEPLSELPDPSNSRAGRNVHSNRDLKQQQTQQTLEDRLNVAPAVAASPAWQPPRLAHHGTPQSGSGSGSGSGSEQASSSNPITITSNGRSITRDALDFGTISLGHVQTLHLKICNAAYRAVDVHFITTGPFSLPTRRISIQPRSYVPVPMAFHPVRPGDFQERLIVRKESSVIRVELYGRAVQQPRGR
ncbi:hypothetical protein BC831DRAFT_243214 [Entophlyctis helioformis]|nr:hypothetical protein BC831DRAFT_243214 [Entophlyctis helioformis]